MTQGVAGLCWQPTFRPAPRLSLQQLAFRRRVARQVALLVALSIGAGSSPLIRIVDVEGVDGRISVTLVTDRMHACQSMIRRKREIHWMFDKLSKRVRILHSFFFAFEFANPKGESHPSTLDYFFCAMGPVMLETIH
jgi:hypothetical protein